MLVSPLCLPCLDYLTDAQLAIEDDEWLDADADSVVPGPPTHPSDSDHAFVHDGGPFIAGNLYRAIPPSALKDNTLLKRGPDGQYYVVLEGRFVGITISK